MCQSTYLFTINIEINKKGTVDAKQFMKSELCERPVMLSPDTITYISTHNIFAFIPEIVPNLYIVVGILLALAFRHNCSATHFDWLL